MKNKIALVTGGSGGLGYHLAKELKNRGYDLVLVSKNPEKLEAAAKKMGAIAYYPIDLAKNYDKMDDILKKHRPSVVINNAGFGIYGDLVKQSMENIESMLNLNIVALTWITKKALEEVPDAHVLNISSVAACRPQKLLAAYAATKAYVEHFTKSLKKDGYNVSYLLLGPTRTSFFKNANMPTKGLERIMLEPEKVAEYAVKKMLKGKTRIVYEAVFKIYCRL